MGGRPVYVHSITIAYDTRTKGPGDRVHERSRDPPQRLNTHIYEAACEANEGILPAQRSMTRFLAARLIRMAAERELKSHAVTGRLTDLLNRKLRGVANPSDFTHSLSGAPTLTSKQVSQILAQIHTILVENCLPGKKGKKFHGIFAQSWWREGIDALPHLTVPTNAEGQVPLGAFVETFAQYLSNLYPPNLTPE